MNEELIEEIAQIWKPWGGPGDYYPFWVKRERTKATLACITRAIMDGELDEMLEVVGQAETEGEWDKGIHRWLDNMIEAKATKFIAFGQDSKERPLGKKEREG